MAIRDPLFLPISGVYGSDELALPLRDLIGEGVVEDGDLLVTDGASGLQINVAKGACYVRGDQDPDGQPTYRVRNDAIVTLTCDVADGSNPRIDRLIVEVLDTSFGGGSNLGQLRIIEGTPAAIPSAPNEPDTAISLALIDVDAGAVALNSADITDVRPFARVGGGVARSSGYVGKMEPWAGSLSGSGLVEVAERGPGWYWQNGALFEEAAHPKLASFLGGAYNIGGEPGGFQRLPDLSDGRSPVGAGPSFARGAKGGASVVALTEAQLAGHVHGAPLHAHPIGSDGAHDHGADPDDGSMDFVVAKGSGTTFDQDIGVVQHATADKSGKTTVNGTHNHGGATGNASGGNTGSAGSGQAHENMPPWQAIGGWIIFAG